MTSSDHELAGALAEECALLVEGLQHHSTSWAPDALGRAVDRRAHRFLVGALRYHRPGDAILSEEAADDPARLRAERVWIIDPLDGTREFGEGRGDWAVHVALWANGELRAGAVAAPGAAGTFCTGRGGRRPPDHPRVVPVVAVSRTRPPAEGALAAEAIGGRLLPLGSAGVKTAAVLVGDADAYVHAGGQHEWDSAAPAAVAREAGLHVSRLDGTPLRYNQPQPWLPDLLICRPDLAPAIVAAAGRAGSLPRTPASAR